MNNDFWVNNNFRQNNQSQSKGCGLTSLRSEKEVALKCVNINEDKNRPKNMLKVILDQISEYKKGLRSEVDSDLYLKGLKGLATNPDNTNDLTPLQLRDDYFETLLDEIVEKRGNWTLFYDAYNGVSLNRIVVTREEMIQEFETAWRKSSLPNLEGNINVSDSFGPEESAEVKKPIDLVILELFKQMKAWRLNPIPLLVLLPKVQFGSFSHETGFNFPQSRTATSLDSSKNGETFFPGFDYITPSGIGEIKKSNPYYKIILDTPEMKMLKGGRNFVPNSVTVAGNINLARIKIIKYLENFEQEPSPTEKELKEFEPGRILDTTDMYCRLSSSSKYPNAYVVRPELVTVIHELLHVLDFASGCDKESGAFFRGPLSNKTIVDNEEKYVSRTSRLIQLIALSAVNFERVLYPLKISTVRPSMKESQIKSFRKSLATLNDQQNATKNLKSLYEVLKNSEWDARFKSCLSSLNINETLIDYFCRWAIS